jgi:Flp pilus assembly protein TadG
MRNRGNRRFAMNRGARHIRGQGLVEFALVLPLFIVLLFGIVEFGRAWMTKNVITGAAREAVRRYAVAPYDNSLGGPADTAAKTALTSAGLDLSQATINFSTPDNTTMQVDVTYNLPLVVGGLVPGLPSDNILLTTSTSMRRE